MNIDLIISEIQILKPLIDYDEFATKREKEKCKQRFETIMDILREISLRKTSKESNDNYKNLIYDILDECSNIRSITSYCINLKPIISNFIYGYS